MLVQLQLILSDYDSVIHVDSDVIFMSPVEQLWHYFSAMNSSQIMAMAPDNTNPNTSWYKLFNAGQQRIPVPTEFSLNTGVILMNLTRMRSVDFFSQLEPIVKAYEKSINWFVNDFMSIYLSRYPDRYLNLSCHWNYLTDHCSAGQLCPAADRSGVALLHGSRSTFVVPYKEPAFYAVYKVFLKYRLNSDLNNELLKPLRNALKDTEHTECGRLSHIFTHYIEDVCRRSDKLSQL